ncbi:MAG TPA: ABC transporter substrate-binding protein [Pyrinomonadaceae bacterium]|jgi:ribose transport system substrate-binding protein|nr:ABC transporter substrate-binding protein [Pyrinomonadaceae bacterium]
MRRPFAAALAATLIVALASAGCRKEGGIGAGNGIADARARLAEKIQRGEKIVVGFSQMENDGPWRIAETASMRDEGAKRAAKYQLLVTDAQGQTSKQVSDVEDLIARGVDVLFLAPREEQGFESALQAAREKHIPVFLIDREVNGRAGEDFVTFIGSNFVEEGRRAGEWLVKQTNGKAGIVELLGTSGASVARDRHDGFAEAIKGQPDMKILTSQTANFNRAQGQKVMENIIQAQGKNITVVYAHNDEMALGAAQALKAAGMQPGKDVIVLSVDGERAALEAIQRGEMSATVECNPRFGPVAFDTLEKFLRGEQLPPKIINQDRFFDSTNAAQFVAEAY